MSYRSIAFQELIVVLHFTPDAYNHLKGKSIDKKASFVIKPTRGFGLRQLIVRRYSIDLIRHFYLNTHYLLFQVEYSNANFVFNRKSVTLSSNVIALKPQYFLLIRFLSCNRTVWSRKVYINRTNQSQLKLHFKWTSNKLQCNHHGNDNEVSEAEILNKITKWRYRGRPILLITLMVTDWLWLIDFSVTYYFL